MLYVLTVAPREHLILRRMTLEADSFFSVATFREHADAVRYCQSSIAPVAPKPPGKSRPAMHKIPEDVRDRVIAKRAAGMEQDAIARKMGISPRSVSRILNGAMRRSVIDVVDYGPSGTIILENTRSHDVFINPKLVETFTDGPVNYIASSPEEITPKATEPAPEPERIGSEEIGPEPAPFVSTSEAEAAPKPAFPQTVNLKTLAEVMEYAAELPGSDAPERRPNGRIFFNNRVFTPSDFLAQINAGRRASGQSMFQVKQGELLMLADTLPEKATAAHKAVDAHNYSQTEADVIAIQLGAAPTKVWREIAKIESESGSPVVDCAVKLERNLKMGAVSVSRYLTDLAKRDIISRVRPGCYSVIIAPPGA